MELNKRNMSQSQLAAKIGVSRQYMSNIMRGISGNVPGVWEKTLDALDLELVAQPKYNVEESTFSKPRVSPPAND
jgi:transcriptional regulator with XRE-family HTH domain